MIVKHGKSIEITSQLSPQAATAIAQWIGGYTVIYNQKTMASRDDYQAWLDAGKPAEHRPESNASAAHFQAELPFLKDIPAQIRRNAGAKWFESHQAALKGIRSRPTVRPKHKKRNCYVTNELFDVQSLDDNRCLIQLKANSGKRHRGQYLTGVVMPFAADAAGKALFLSRKGRRFWLSMSFDKTLDVMSEDAVRQYAASLTDAELEHQIVGYDLGVKRQVTGSNSTVHHLLDEATVSLGRLERRRVRYQRKYARIARANDRAAGTVKRKRTGGEQKVLAKIGRYSEKKANIQSNNSHRISKRIADNTPLIAAFEDLKISNMVRRPKAKLCEDTGRWLANGASAKRSLNRVIHAVNMGQIRQFTEYKLKDRGKLMVRVKPHYSSQECSQCGHTEKGNRPSQSTFKCLACGFAANADDNASWVIKKRGITHVRSESFSKGKARRTIKVRRKQARELASSGSGDCVSPGSQAVISDALNSRQTIEYHGLSETRGFSRE
jgi:putative transposase